jgi:dienelactone hydrolase
MKYNERYSFFIILIVTVFSYIGCSSQSEVQEMSGSYISGEGPGWVKESLENNGVFQEPPFYFTNKYDQYKQHQNIKGLFFNGLDYHENPTKVFCWYGVPENLKEGVKVPAVVLVHGGGGTVFPQWVKKWTDRGYAAISIALEGQAPGPKDPKSPLEIKHPVHEFSGPFRKGFFLDVKNEKLENQWFYHAVADIILANSLIRSFRETDSTKIGITGISWGGILANVVTGIDKRFAFAIPVYGCGYLYESPIYINQLKAHSKKSRQFYMETWEPSLYIPKQNQPTLFINGTNDHHFPMNSFTKTYRASNSEKYLHVEHEMKHGHHPGWVPEEIYSFANYITRGSKKPLTLKTNSKNKKIIDFEGTVNNAITYYTKDTDDWKADNYKWIKADAFISKSNKTITPELPDDALYYFINAVTDGVGMYSSSMIKLE